MKNWNTDTTKFKSPQEKRLWELAQLLNYGLDGQTLKAQELKDNWSYLKDRLNPEVRRLWEFILWQKVSSLPTKPGFWTPLPKTLNS